MRFDFYHHLCGIELACYSH